MNLLIVSATSIEIEPLLGLLGKQKVVNQKLTEYNFKEHKIDVLVPGVGMTSTAFWMGKAMAGMEYELALNLGIAGSFNRDIELGEVVNVTEDQFPEMGAEDGEQFLSMVDLDLLEDDDFVMANGRINNNTEPDNAVISGLKKVGGITVNTVHGNDISIENVVQKHGPQVETMEGGAFLYACLAENIPCAQVRAVSNYVEWRNKNSWQLPKAIENLNQNAIEILEALT